MHIKKCKTRRKRKIILIILRLKKIFRANGGYITREDVGNANISSWFLSDFVKRNNFNKIAPGFYANDNYYYILQRRYPKYVFLELCALYLLGFTDKIPTDIEVSAPQNYHPSRSKIDLLIIHKLSNVNVYELGIEKKVYELMEVVTIAY